MPRLQECIENREKIHRIVEEMLEIGVRQAAALIATAKSSDKNSNKTSTRMRRK
jgi:hypothetical protein